MDQDRSDPADDAAAQNAEELMEAAAYTPEGRGRLWRLEWAQAFQRLAEFGRQRRDGD